MGKILIIEDDPLLGKLYNSSLITSGFEVEIAKNGEEGLSKILEGGYDLIMLDVMLPVMDGLAVLASLRGKKPEKGNGPIVVTTNLSSEAITQKALSLGAAEVVDKGDLKAEKLLKKIHTWLKY